MSSLRIAQHRGVIGASADRADNARSEAASDGASFAGALDAAGAAPRSAPSSPGTAGDPSGGTPEPRKRGEASAKSTDAPIMLAEIASAAIGTPIAVATSGGSFGGLSPTPSAASAAQVSQTGGGAAVLPGKTVSVDGTMGDGRAAGFAMPLPRGSVGLPASPVGAVPAAEPTARSAAGPALTTDPTVPPPSVPVVAAMTSGPLVAGISTTGTDPAEVPATIQATSSPAAVSITGRPATPPAEIVLPSAAPMNPDLTAAFPAAIAGGRIEPGASFGRTAEGARARTPPASPTDAGPNALAPTPGIPLAARTPSATPLLPGDGVMGAPPLTADTTIAIPAGTASDAGASAPTVVPSDRLTALGSVPAPPSLLADAPLPVAPAAFVPIGEVSRDGRARFQSFGAASDTAITPAAAAAPVAGADVPPTAAATSPDLVPDPATTGGGVSDQVAAHLVRMVSSGSRDMVMRLRPPELGDVTVRVAVSGRDVSAWFASPQPQVQSAISAAIGQLQTGLGDAGYNLSGAWVGGDAANAQQQRSGPPVPPTVRTVPASPAVSPMAATQRPAASGLNVYV